MIELQVDPQGTTDNYALLISCKNMVVKRIFKQNELATPSDRETYNIVQGFNHRSS